MSIMNPEDSPIQPDVKGQITTLRESWQKAFEDEIAMRSVAEAHLADEWQGTVTVKKSQLDLRNPATPVGYRPDDEIEIKLQKDDEGKPQWMVRNKTLSEEQAKEPPQGEVGEITVDELDDFANRVDSEKIGVHKLRDAVSYLRNNKGPREKIYGFRASDGGVAGVAIGSADHEHLFLRDIATDPDQEDKGVGSAMLSGLKKRYDSISLNPVTFSLNRSTQEGQSRLIRFYKQNGFVSGSRWSKTQASIDDRENADRWIDLGRTGHYQIGFDSRSVDANDVVRVGLRAVINNNDLKDQLSPATQTELLGWSAQFARAHALETQRELLSIRTEEEARAKRLEELNLD